MSSNNQHLQNLYERELRIIPSATLIDPPQRQTCLVPTEPIKWRAFDQLRIRFDDKSSDDKENVEILSAPLRKYCDDNAGNLRPKEIVKSKDLSSVRPSAMAIPSHSAFEADSTNVFAFSQILLRPNNKRKSDAVCIDEVEEKALVSKVVKPCVMEGRPTLKRRKVGVVHNTNTFFSL